jgi:hypothetical protein
MGLHFSAITSICMEEMAPVRIALFRCTHRYRTLSGNLNMVLAAGLLDDLYMWSPATRAWTNLNQNGSVVSDCSVSSMNDFSCIPDSPCYLLCGSGSVGRLAASPNKYASNEAMTWIIGSDKADVTIRLNFTFFNTEGFFDWVEVYSCTSRNCIVGSLLLKHSGNTLPPILYSSTGMIKIKWTTDFSVQHTGWSADWTSFEMGRGQCVNGYSAVAGDIYGCGSVNGVGGGMTVSSCLECLSLCDQQGAACRSTECSPSALKCNLNDRSTVDTTTNYLDYVFCQKPASTPAGNDSKSLRS